MPVNTEKRPTPSFSHRNNISFPSTSSPGVTGTVRGPPSGRATRRPERPRRRARRGARRGPRPGRRSAARGAAPATQIHSHRSGLARARSMDRNQDTGQFKKQEGARELVRNIGLEGEETDRAPPPQTRTGIPRGWPTTDPTLCRTWPKLCDMCAIASRG
jgi:hypothetical protein